MPWYRVVYFEGHSILQTVTENKVALYTPVRDLFRDTVWGNQQQTALITLTSWIASSLLHAACDVMSLNHI